MLLNLYGVIYIACIDVYYSQFFVVLFQHAIHKTLQVAPLAHIFGFEAAPLFSPTAPPPSPPIINDQSPMSACF